jgi:hypothetical protein
MIILRSSWTGVGREHDLTAAYYTIGPRRKRDPLVTDHRHAPAAYLPGAGRITR